MEYKDKIKADVKKATFFVVYTAGSKEFFSIRKMEVLEKIERGIVLKYFFTNDKEDTLAIV